MQANDKLYIPLISGVSVAIPLVVAVLLYIPGAGLGQLDVSFLPFLNACINASVAVLLVGGLIFIRAGRILQHKICMLSAFILSALFLLSYVTYHFATTETRFGGTGTPRLVYLLILGSHIVLSMATVPLATLTIYRSLSGDFVRHKKIARITFPIWLYVAVTGVIVYTLISPYYHHLK